MNNPYEYYNEYSVENLKKEQESLVDDIEYITKHIEEKDVKSEQLTDFYNDLKEDRDKLLYINGLLREYEENKPKGLI